MNKIYLCLSDAPSSLSLCLTWSSLLFFALSLLHSLSLYFSLLSIFSLSLYLTLLTFSLLSTVSLYRARFEPALSAISNIAPRANFPAGCNTAEWNVKWDCGMKLVNGKREWNKTAATAAAAAKTFITVWAAVGFVALWPLAHGVGQGRSGQGCSG